MSVFRRDMTDAQREQELTRLMAQHKTQLIRMAYMYLGDMALAEEAVQDTFLKAYAHMERFRGEASEVTWLMRIGINTCKDVQRTAWFRSRSKMLTLENVPEQGREDPTPDDVVLRAVMALPDKEKQVILLRYYQNLTVPNLAQTLGISAACATSRLNRARKRLYSELKGWYFDEE